MGGGVERHLCPRQVLREQQLSGIAALDESDQALGAGAVAAVEHALRVHALGRIGGGRLEEEVPELLADGVERQRDALVEQAHQRVEFVGDVHVPDGDARRGRRPPRPRWQAARRPWWRAWCG